MTSDAGRRASFDFERAVRLALSAPLLLLWLVSAADATPARRHPVSLKMFLPGVERVELMRTTTGGLVYSVRTRDGVTLSLAPDAFAEWVHQRATRRPLWLRVLNISSPVGVAWVAVGLLGQLAFTGRMLFQWLVSEREGRSVIPVGFWWMSIGGASMLLVYFVWRKDVIGILGQSAGFLIYARNLWLIHRGQPPVLGS